MKIRKPIVNMPRPTQRRIEEGGRLQGEEGDLWGRNHTNAGNILTICEFSQIVLLPPPRVLDSKQCFIEDFIREFFPHCSFSACCCGSSSAGIYTTMGGVVLEIYISLLSSAFPFLFDGIMLGALTVLLELRLLRIIVAPHFYVLMKIDLYLPFFRWPSLV